MLSRVMPGDGAPWDAVWWGARIHLALFVHRVDGVEPGLYLLLREPEAASDLRARCGATSCGSRRRDALPLIRLARGDCRLLARRLSCDQDIAADGFFSLGMIADFDASLEEYGPSFYRQLFWESGVVGQVLYLEAEAAGVRATGIGCFYDDPVHEVLGLDRPRVPEPLSLHDRHAGGGHATDDRAGVFLGAICEPIILRVFVSSWLSVLNDVRDESRTAAESRLRHLNGRP